MPHSVAIEEMLDEEPKINLTPMIDIVFLLLIFFMLMKFKTLEKRLETFLPKDEGLMISKPVPVKQLRLKLELLPGSTDKVQIIPQPAEGAFHIVPYSFVERNGRKDHSAMFAQVTAMIRAGFNAIGDKIEISPEVTVPFEFVALTVDAIHRAQVDLPEDQVKRITFQAPPPTGVPTGE